jgi:hypothetical protein
MALIQLAAVLPVAALTIVAGLWATTLSDRLVTTSPTTDEVVVDWSALGQVFAAAVPVILLGALLGVLINLATIQLLVQRATGQPLSIGAALRTCLSRALPMIGWSIVAGLLTLVGIVFCILPGIYVAAVVSILPAVVLLERGQGVARCFRLFHANLGDSIGRVVTIGGITIVVGIVDNLVTSALTAGHSPSTVLTVISAIISAIFSLATGIVVPALLLTTYADMRARHEPFSTAYLMPDAPPPPPSLA